MTLPSKNPKIKAIRISSKSYTINRTSIPEEAERVICQTEITTAKSIIITTSMTTVTPRTVSV
jgi:hypothetical protein